VVGVGERSVLVDFKKKAKKRNIEPDWGGGGGKPIRDLRHEKKKRVVSAFLLHVKKPKIDCKPGMGCGRIGRTGNANRDGRNWNRRRKCLKREEG